MSPWASFAMASLISRFCSEMFVMSSRDGGFFLRDFGFESRQWLGIRGLGTGVRACACIHELNELPVKRCRLRTERLIGLRVRGEQCRDAFRYLIAACGQRLAVVGVTAAV